MSIVRTEDLKKIFERIIVKLKYEKVEQIEIDTDLYRFVPTDEWENFEKDVIELGSLGDDVESLMLMIKDSDRPCTYVDFDRVASLLRAISQKNNPP